MADAELHIKQSLSIFNESVVNYIERFLKNNLY